MIKIIGWRSGLMLVAALTVYSGQASAQSVTVSELAQQTHIHGLAIDGLDPDRLLIATHHGLFRAEPHGEAERISVVQDFMGFTQHPTQPGTLYASGHPADGGNLGFIVSTDNGAGWEPVSPGVGGPVDFHQMTVSLADPKVIYGSYRGLQVSRDSGRTWAMAGPLPSKLIDLAASANDAGTLYAATESGLLASTDAGGTWTAVIEGAPVSLVEVAADGTHYAFVLGRGLLKSADGREFEPVGNDEGDRILLHLAVDPADPKRMFASSHHGDIVKSLDGGASWAPFGD